MFSRDEKLPNRTLWIPAKAGMTTDYAYRGLSRSLNSYELPDPQRLSTQIRHTSKAADPDLPPTPGIYV